MKAFIVAVMTCLIAVIINGIFNQYRNGDQDDIDDLHGTGGAA